jgi:glutamine amidotransferase
LKVPHMGWNHLRVVRPAPLFAGLGENAAVYFVHSYHVVPRDPALVATETDYPTPFVSSIWRDNVFGVQFHPEKSQRVGLGILHKFVMLR